MWGLKSILRDVMNVVAANDIYLRTCMDMCSRFDMDRCSRFEASSVTLIVVYFHSLQIKTSNMQFYFYVCVVEINHQFDYQLRTFRKEKRTGKMMKWMENLGKQQEATTIHEHYCFVYICATSRNSLSMRQNGNSRSKRVKPEGCRYKRICAEFLEHRHTSESKTTNWREVVIRVFERIQSTR